MLARQRRDGVGVGGEGDQADQVALTPTQIVAVARDELREHLLGRLEPLDLAPVDDRLLLFHRARTVEHELEGDALSGPLGSLVARLRASQRRQQQREAEQTQRRGEPGQACTHRGRGLAGDRDRRVQRAGSARASRPHQRQQGQQGAAGEGPGPGEAVDGREGVDHARALLASIKDRPSAAASRTRSAIRSASLAGANRASSSRSIKDRAEPSTRSPASSRSASAASAHASTPGSPAMRTRATGLVAASGEQRVSRARRAWSAARQPRARSCGRASRRRKRATRRWAVPRRGLTTRARATSSASSTLPSSRPS